MDRESERVQLRVGSVAWAFAEAETPKPHQPLLKQWLESESVLQLHTLTDDAIAHSGLVAGLRGSLSAMVGVAKKAASERRPGKVESRLKIIIRGHIKRESLFERFPYKAADGVRNAKCTEDVGTE